jgi:hypothetical protein
MYEQVLIYKITDVRQDYNGITTPLQAGPGLDTIFRLSIGLEIGQ